MICKITLKFIKIKKNSPFIEYTKEYELRFSLGRAFETILDKITHNDERSES